MFEISPKTKILIVSLDGTLAFNIKNTLKKAGLNETTTESNGIQALRLAATQQFPVILVNQDIEAVEGWLFVVELKNSDRTLNPAVVMFGNGDCRVTPANMKQYGIAGFLRTPIVFKELMGAISLGMSESQRSGSTESRYSDAKKALIEQRSDEAVRIFSELHSQTNKSSRSTIGLIQALEQKKDFSAADANTRELTNSGGDAFSAAMLSFKMHLRSKNFTAAKEHLEKCLALAGESPYYYLQLADITLRAEVWDLAASICEQALRKNFDYQDFHVGLAKVAYSRGDAAGAVKRLSSVRKKFAPTIEALNLHGICLRKLGKFADAKGCYEEALTLAPTDPKLTFNIGLICMAQADFAAAVRYFEACLKISPNFVKAQEKIAEIQRGTPTKKVS